MFTGFSQETVDFLWGIRFNNERGWFEAHKADYLRYALAPLRELGEELYDYMAGKYPALWLNLHVSRIYRDARRLFGRGPYKDHLWLSLRHENEGWTSRPVFYFEIMPEGYSYGMGFYDATPQVMERFRARAAADPGSLERLARRLSRQKDFSLEGDCYARPKPAPTPALESWISRKNITLCRDLPYDEVSFSPALAEQVKRGFDFLVPYYEYFAALCREAEGFTNL